jgi:hypothetical protein
MNSIHYNYTFYSYVHKQIEDIKSNTKSEYEVQATSNLLIHPAPCMQCQTVPEHDTPKVIT